LRIEVAVALPVIFLSAAFFSCRASTPV